MASLVEEVKCKHQTMKKKAHLTTLRKVAILVLALLTASCLLFSSEQVRAAVSSFFLQFHSGHVNFRTDNSRERENLINRSYYQLQYIPEGYELTYTNNRRNAFLLYQYTNENNVIFSFDLCALWAGAVSSIDTESYTLEEFDMDNMKFYYFNSTEIPSSINILIWSDEYTMFKLYGNLTKDELLKIYKNIIYQEPES